MTRFARDGIHTFRETSRKDTFRTEHGIRISRGFLLKLLHSSIRDKRGRLPSSFRLLVTGTRKLANYVKWSSGDAVVVVVVVLIGQPGVVESLVIDLAPIHARVYAGPPQGEPCYISFANHLPRGGSKLHHLHGVSVFGNVSQEEVL